MRGSWSLRSRKVVYSRNAQQPFLDPVLSPNRECQSGCTTVCAARARFKCCPARSCRRCRRKRNVVRSFEFFPFSSRSGARGRRAGIHRCSMIMDASQFPRRSFRFVAPVERAQKGSPRSEKFSKLPEPLNASPVHFSTANPLPRDSVGKSVRNRKRISRFRLLTGRECSGKRGKNRDDIVSLDHTDRCKEIISVSKPHEPFDRSFQPSYPAASTSRFRLTRRPDISVGSCTLQNEFRLEIKSRERKRSLETKDTLLPLALSR